VLATTIVVIHLGLVLFIGAGLPLIYVGRAHRWRWVRDWRWRVVHLGAIAVVAAEALAGVVCPLTLWEDAARGQSSQQGFIERWVDRILFYDLPPWMFTVAYIAFAAAVVLTWFAVPPDKCLRKAPRNSDRSPPI
jgi:hypothetical protein